MTPHHHHKPYSFIFDFDGVIADTYDVYIEFLVKKMKLSRKYAKRKFEYTSTELTSEPSNWLWKLGSMWYYYRFYRYVANHKDDLLFPNILEQVASFPGPKAILTLAEKRVCEAVLKEDITLFERVIGRNEASYKPNGFKIIMEMDQFRDTHPIFITDTAADIQNMLTILPQEQIFAVDWGFNDPEVMAEILGSENIIRTDFTEFVQQFQRDIPEYYSNFRGDIINIYQLIYGYENTTQSTDTCPILCHRIPYPRYWTPLCISWHFECLCST